MKLLVALILFSSLFADKVELSQHAAIRDEWGRVIGWVKPGERFEVLEMIPLALKVQVGKKYGWTFGSPFMATVSTNGIFYATQELLAFETDGSQFLVSQGKLAVSEIKPNLFRIKNSVKGDWEEGNVDADFVRWIR